MFENIKSYFVHHRTERNGTIAVAMVIILGLAGTELYLHLRKPPGIPAELLALLENSNLASQNSSEQLHSENSQGQAEVSSATLFRFNPNTLSDSGYTALGFSMKQVESLRKYMAKGGTFRKKSDFARLYFVDEDAYQRLEPYIDLPEAYAQNRSKPETSGQPSERWIDTAQIELYRYKPLLLDLNTADTTELKKLKGIGSYFAKRIVEYRGRLGGFHRLEQLLELQKMSTETIDGFSDKVTIDYSAITPIKINKATAQELASHPYINMKLANRLVTYREAHQKLSSYHQLQDAGLLDEELTLKLVPYLSFE